jgi:hypothetical protein
MDFENTVILAINGSVLGDVARIIPRYLDAGLRVLAVVAPCPAQEQAALAQANAMPATTDEHVQAWIRTGPARCAAAAVRADLRAVGVRAAEVDPALISPTVRGPVLDAEPRLVNARALAAAWRESPLVVIPAGVALTQDRRPAILSDGSALATALFFGERLGLAVRGVRSANALSAWADSFSLGFDEALDLNLSGSDRRAVLFARRHGVPFELATPASRVTAIGLGNGPRQFFPEDRPGVSSRVGRAAAYRIRPGTASRLDRGTQVPA